MTSKESANAPNARLSMLWVRAFYGLFILTSLYFFVFSKDIETGTTTLALGLIFDPFNQAVAWAQRPRWQRAWLIIHLTLVLAGFAFMLFD